MTPKMELTEEMRAALERVPDEWSKWPRGVKVHQALLLAAGLIQIARPYAKLHTTTVRRTPAGRAALGEGE